MSQKQQPQSPQGPPSIFSARYSDNLRAIIGAFAHHGRPLRGLMSTAKSPNFEGRFGRMFRSLPAGTYGRTDNDSLTRY